MLSYETINNKLKYILSSRLNTLKTKKFKSLLKELKENYGFTISKEYIKKTLFEDKTREFQKVLNQRINRVIKKAEIKAVKKPYFFKKLTSEKGVLFYEQRKKLLTFLIV